MNKLLIQLFYQEKFKQKSKELLEEIEILKINQKQIIQISN